MWSGVVLRVTCKVLGAKMTNEDLASAGITRNKRGSSPRSGIHASSPAEPQAT
jgi:hypothetical protein